MDISNQPVNHSRIWGYHVNVIIVCIVWTVLTEKQLKCSLYFSTGIFLVCTKHATKIQQKTKC